MICSQCKRPISGVEMPKAVVEYVQPDGTTKVYGWDRPDGKPSWLGGAVTGRLSRAWHYKHYMALVRQESRTSTDVYNLSDSPDAAAALTPEEAEKAKPSLPGVRMTTSTRSR